MGVNDPHFKIVFEKYLDRILRITDKPINKVAWLGASNIDAVGPKTFKEIHADAGGDLSQLEMDYFDVIVKEKTKYWDINSSWEEISGYDLVIAWRIAPYCEDADHFSEQLSKLLDTNSCIIFDFFVGGPTFIPVLFPYIARRALGEAINVNIEEYSAIFSWDNIFIQVDDDKRRYKDFFLLPFFEDLYKKYLEEIKLETGYDISRSAVIPRSPENVLTDKKLSKYGVRVKLDTETTLMHDLHNTFSIHDPRWEYSDPEFLKILQPLYGTRITEPMVKYMPFPWDPKGGMEWYQPLSPFIANSHSTVERLPTKQLHLIVQFEKE